jgi:hypothetical protein
MSRVKSYERIKSDERGDRRRQAPHIAFKSKTGGRKTKNNRKK